MPGDKTFFNIHWTNSEQNPDWSKWLVPVKNLPNSAFCKKCNKRFSLSNMGAQAIRSHEQGKNHQKLVNNQKLVTIKDMFNAKVAEVSTDSSEDPVAISNSSAPKTQKTLDELIIKKETTVAEILCALRIIMKNESFNSCKDDSYLFKKMFSDSTIANKFSMGPDKASYLINYSLEEKKKKMAEAEKVILSQKRQLAKIKELKAKKIKLSKTSAMEIELLNSEIAKEEDILKNMCI